jgi:hypothetical protein
VVVMNDEQAVVPVEQKTVPYRGNELIAVRGENEVVYVPIKPICETLSVQWSAQSKRIRRDPVLSEVAASVSIMDTQTDSPQRRAMTCLPLDYLNGWLFGISANRIKDEAIRELVIEYQKECYQVLAAAFGIGTVQEATGVSPAVRALMQVEEMGLAIARMAREQIQFEMRLTTTETRLDTAVVVIDSLTGRVESLEQQLTPGSQVTEDQASQVSQAVKTVAMKLSKASGRNEYGGVYGELYRKFGITSYKQLPLAKFDEAMKWLNAWRENIEGDAPF